MWMPPKHSSNDGSPLRLRSPCRYLDVAGQIEALSMNSPF